MRVQKPCWARFGLTIVAMLIAGGDGVSAERQNLPPGTVRVGSAKQLFLGDRFVDIAEGVTLTVNPPRKTGEILLKADRPWETSIGAFHSILKEEDGLLRMWYEIEDYTRDISYICHATSKDGLRWTKPVLGLHKDMTDSTKNNIVMVGTCFAKKTRLVGGTVVKDFRAKPDKRYKFVWLVLGAHSPDGLHWTRYPKSLFTGIAGDTHPVAFWDDRIRRYVAYSRHNMWEKCTPEEAKRYGHAARVKGNNILRRHVMRGESDDFENWGKFKSVLAPGRKGKHRGYDFYNSGAVKYPWAADAYFFHTSRYHYEANSLDVQLAVSRDGIRFRRPSSTPFIPRGKKGSFDSRGIYVLTGPITMGDEIWIYYAGENVGHGREYLNAIRAGKRGYSISRAVLRLDGYTSMDAGPAGGTLVTNPVIFAGDRMVLNVRTKPGGSVTVELCNPETVDAQGLPEDVYCESRPITGDSTAAAVKWKGGFDIRTLAGKPILMQFRMRDAKLYAFQFLSAK